MILEDKKVAMDVSYTAYHEHASEGGEKAHVAKQEAVAKKDQINKVATLIKSPRVILP